MERTVTGFFDNIENVIENRVHMTMHDMASSVDKFLHFNEYNLLLGKGNISKAQADQKAIAEYKIFNKTQKIHSEFDRVLLKQLKQKETGNE